MLVQKNMLTANLITDISLGFACSYKYLKLQNG